MKIVFTDHTNQEHEQYVREQLGTHDLVFTEKTLDDFLESTPADDVDVLAVFVSSRVSKEHTDQLPNLKFITTRSTGFDHIDLEETKARSIAVSNVPFYGSNTVAEHAMALLLSLTRKIPESVERVRDGSFTYEGLQGVDLMDKTLGIVGGGHIGLHMAQMANGFGMKVLVYDIKQDPALASEYTFTYEMDLNALLRQSDVVSLHLPLNEHTMHIMNDETFQHMKQGSYLINTARGGLIDTNALVKAIHSGKVAGVGLDVLEGEEFLRDELKFLAEEHTEEEMRSVLEDHILVELPNVLVTPHNAFNTKEAHFRNLQTSVENIQAFINGSPQNVVNV